MAETLRYRYLGDAHRGRRLTHAASVQRQLLRRNMEFQNLSQGVRKVIFDDGSIIECTSVFGTDIVSIYAPPPINLELHKCIMLEVVENGRVYVEIKDPDFNPWENNSHKLYWMYDLDVFNRLVNNVVIAQTGVCTVADHINAMLSVGEHGVLVGENIVLVPFNFSAIEAYCPVHPTYGLPSTNMASGVYTEAKSFQTDFSRFVGYCGGTIVNSKSKEITDFRLSGTLKYQQFQILGNILVWFGNVQHCPGIYHYWDLYSKTYKITDSGELEKLGEFMHYDYKGILDGPAHRVKLTEDPEWGNILTNIGAPASVEGICSADENEVKFCVPFMIRDPGKGELSPYGNGADGGCMELVYAHNGMATHDGTTQVWNKTGAVADEFESFVWVEEINSKRGGFHLIFDCEDSPYYDDPDTTPYEVKQSSSISFKVGDIIKKEHALYHSYVNETRYSTEWWLGSYNVYGEGTAYDNTSQSVPVFTAGAQCVALRTIGQGSQFRYSRGFSYPTAYWKTSYHYPAGNVSSWEWDYHMDMWKGGLDSGGCTGELLFIEFSEDYPQPDNWGVDAGNSDWGQVGASESYEHDVWHNQSDCYRRHDFYRGHYVYVVCDNMISGDIPDTGVIHQISMDGCDENTSCMRTHLPTDYEGMTWEDKEALINSSCTQGYHAKQTDTDEHGWDNNIIISQKQGFVSKYKSLPVEDHVQTIVYFSDTVVWSVDRALRRRGVGLEDKGIYNPSYAFMDDRACGNGVFCFVGTSDEYKDEGGLINNMALDKWNILSFHKRNGNYTLIDVTLEFFSLLNLDPADTDQIVSMGMF